jgi:hypothetical protein
MQSLLQSAGMAVERIKKLTKWKIGKQKIAKSRFRCKTQENQIN